MKIKIEIEDEASYGRQGMQELTASILKQINEFKEKEKETEPLEKIDEFEREIK